jgi:pimeloyl-ACP methyl ester carboxylesterase
MHDNRILPTEGILSERHDAPEWFLRATAVTPEEHCITIEGKRLEVLSWGEIGFPGLLLLHGNMAHARWWSFIAPFFANRFRVVAFSFSGMGRSDWAPSYSIEGYAAEAIGVAETLELANTGDFSVVGHSAGGGAAAVLAALSGDHLRRAIFIDSLIIPEGPPLSSADVRPRRVYRSIEDAVAHFRLVPAQPRTNELIIDWIARQSLQLVDGGWSWAFDPALPGRFSARKAWDYVARAACPLTFLNGALSALTGVERLAPLRERLPDSAFVEIPEAHHHVMIDQPLALVAALSAILDLDQASAATAARAAEIQ